jgi:transcriptional regulator with XRE-family HTH domain
VAKVRDTKLIKKFGKHLRALREDQGLSQEGLAIEADVPISQIGRIERGEINPTLSTLYSLASALKIPLPELTSF